MGYQFDSGALILKYLLNAVTIFFAVTLFEYIKAFTAVRLGDTLPKQQGRLTLNPIKHFEPIGYLLFLFLGYGWGKPVETSGLYTHDFGKGVYGNRKISVIITYLTPMLVSLLIGMALCRVSVFLPTAAQMAVFSLADNLISLFIFNIIPVYPLCGSRILKSLLSPNASLQFSRYEKILQMIVIFLLLLRYLTYPLDMFKAFIETFAMGML